MPKLKIPASLYNTALTRTRLWIVKVATAIYRTFGNYESVGCQQAIFQFNQFLISSVPTQIIDELYNSIEVLLESEVEDRCRIPYIDKHVKFDKRILLALYIQKNMKTLNAHKVVNDIFWKLTLPRFENLLRLDLNKVCTDEILEVVGKHCKNLEFVNIVSKSCHTRTKDRHNALKLQLCVSDVGLDFLSNCKYLREIQMTSIIRKGCGGRQITNDGIKRLLLSLPQLRRINYTDTGLLLDSMTSDIGPLALVSVTDYHPRAVRIPKIELLCPYLIELHLTYAFSSDDYRSDVISALSSSGLKISVLSLTNFPFDDFLKTYLELKGVFLKEFNFVSSFIQSVNELFRLLGWTCPILERMHMHFHVFDRGYITNQCPFSNTLDSKSFSNLKSLIIKGVYWDANHVLPLLLINATSIEKVVLNNHSYSGSLDDTLEQVQKKNRFLCLETVSFLKGVNVSFQCFKKFVLACPVLKQVTVESDSPLFVDLMAQLKEELTIENMDVNVDIYSTA